MERQRGCVVWFQADGFQRDRFALGSDKESFDARTQIALHSLGRENPIDHPLHSRSADVESKKG